MRQQTIRDARTWEQSAGGPGRGGLAHSRAFQPVMATGGAPSPTAPSPSTNPARVALTILAGAVWLAVSTVADLLAFLMFAFADSPSSANAAKLMIVPVFVWFGVT